MTQDLRRVIGFSGGTALIVGITIGSGIFRTPPTIAGLVPSPLVIMALWVAFGLISICGALTVAELSSMLPRAAACTCFCARRMATPRRSYSAGCTCSSRRRPAWRRLPPCSPSFFSTCSTAPAHAVTVQAIAIAAIVTLTFANVLGARVGAAVSELTTLVKVTALAAIILGAFLLGEGSAANFVAGGPVRGEGLARAVASVIWTYDGWIAVSMIAGEVVAPERLMKRIIIAGMLVIVTLYVGANLAYFYMMPVGVLAQQKEAVARTVMHVDCRPGRRHCNHARDNDERIRRAQRQLPGLSARHLRDGARRPDVRISRERIHPRWSSPWVAVLIEGVAAIALVLVLRDFDTLTTFFIVVQWAALIFAVAAVFVLRRKMADAPRPFRTPGYPWVPMVFVLGTLVGVTAIVWGEIQARQLFPDLRIVHCSGGSSRSPPLEASCDSATSQTRGL